MNNAKVFFSVIYAKRKTHLDSFCFGSANVCEVYEEHGRIVYIFSKFGIRDGINISHMIHKNGNYLTKKLFYAKYSKLKEEGIARTKRNKRKKNLKTTNIFAVEAQSYPIYTIAYISAVPFLNEPRIIIFINGMDRIERELKAKMLTQIKYAIFILLVISILWFTSHDCYI